MIHHGGHERSQYETRESKYRPNSSYQRNHRGPNPSRPYSTFRPRYYRNYPNERRENHTAEYPPRDTHPLTSYSPRTDYDDHIATSNPAPGDTWRGKFQPRRQYETEANYTMPTRKYSPDYRLPVPPATNCVWLPTRSVALYNEVLLKILPIYVCIFKWTFNITENRECYAHTDDVWLFFGWRQGLSLWQPMVSSDASGLTSCISWFLVTWSSLMQRYMVIYVFFWLTFLCRNLMANCKIITWSIQGGNSILVNFELFTVYHNLSVFLCVFLSMLTACVPKFILFNVEFYHCPCHCLYIGDSSDNDGSLSVLACFFVSI